MTARARAAPLLNAFSIVVCPPAFFRFNPARS